MLKKTKVSSIQKNLVSHVSIAIKSFVGKQHDRTTVEYKKAYDTSRAGRTALPHHTRVQVPTVFIRKVKKDADAKINLYQ